MLRCLFVINKYFVKEICSESLFAVSKPITFVVSQLTKFVIFPDGCPSKLKLCHQRKV